MKNYLSFGGGVNSTACIVLKAQGRLNYAEAIYVDHGCDWPETRAYVQMLAKQFPITILKPQVEGFSNLYGYASKYNMTPSRQRRWCTDKFKVRVIHNYVERPCFSLIGFSTEEEHRARISSENGIENRFPLLELEIDRDECVKIIRDYGLPVPMKSGCWFCPFQRIGQWKKLRRVHPDLFCKAEQLEQNHIVAREKRGKKGCLLASKTKRLGEVVNQRQSKLWKEDEYPPCECML